MNNVNKELIQKIQKLLALSKSNNNNEANTALAKAQELLAKHKLTMKDVENQQDSIVNVIKKATDFTFDYKAQWKGALARIIADNTCCHLIYHQYKKYTIVFIGKEEDVAIATIMYEYALGTINRLANSLARKRNRQGLSGAGVLNDVGLGFCRGLMDMFEEQARKHQEWGLVLVKSPEVNKFVENLNIKAKVAFEHKYHGNDEAYDAGKEEGKKFSISDKIENEGDTGTGPALLA